MATPQPDNYSCASGQSIYAGIHTIPSWIAALTPNTWEPMADTDYDTYGGPLISPQSGYNGTNPIRAIVDAYCDGTFDAVNKIFYFYGGGHGDGTCNAIPYFDLKTLAWGVAFQPTDPSKYPPSYSNGGSLQPGPLVYPSGFEGGGYFRDDLTDPADTAYLTDRARASSHMYAASAARENASGQTEIAFFYGKPALFNTVTGVWADMYNIDFGSQLYALNTNYNNVSLQQGTVALYDSVTDRYYVTLNPGDSGGGWRSHIMKIHPETFVIESMKSALLADGSPMGNSINMTQVGRWIYGFSPTGGYGNPQDINRGWRWNIDTDAFEYITCTGDQIIFYAGANQETVCPFYNQNTGKYYRWDFAAANIGALYELNLTPTGGDGSAVSPWLLTQTRTALSGTPPASAKYCFRRFSMIPEWGIAMVLPHAGSNWYAVKL